MNFLAQLLWGMANEAFNSKIIIHTFIRTSLILFIRTSKSTIILIQTRMHGTTLITYGSKKSFRMNGGKRSVAESDVKMITSDMSSMFSQDRGWVKNQI
jgi:hypothetical protein